MIKKALVCTAGVICILAAFAFAAEKTVKEPNQGVDAKQANTKTARMNARGKVVDISDKAITIERTIKGSIEKMEFALGTTVEGVAVNDFVKIDYSVKDGKLTASRVARLVEKAKQPAKMVVAPIEEKPVSGTK